MYKTVDEINLYISNFLSEKLGTRHGIKRNIAVFQDKQIIRLMEMDLDNDYKIAIIIYLVKNNRKTLIFDLYCKGLISSVDEKIISKKFLDVFNYLRQFSELVSDFKNGNHGIRYKKLNDIDRILNYEYFLDEYKDSIYSAKDWYDGEHRLIQFFGYKNSKYIFKEPSDYLEVIKTFLKFGLKSDAFCKITGIDDPVGFESMRKVAASKFTNDIKFLVDDIKEGLELEAEELALKFDNGQINIESLLKDCFDYSYRFTRIYEKMKNKDLLINQLFDYISKYKDELLFDRLLVLFDYNYSSLRSSIDKYGKLLCYEYDDIKSILDIVSLYEVIIYNKKELIRSLNLKGCEVDEETVVAAKNYLKEKGIGVCPHTISLTCEKIANGDLKVYGSKDDSKLVRHRDIYRGK